MEHFYLFELQTKYHYKFGMTRKHDPLERINQYTGLNKPSRIIKVYTVEDGCLEQNRFYEFLKQNNIAIFSGKEFFYYDRDIDTLLESYFQNKETIILNPMHSHKRMVYKPGEFVRLKRLQKLFSMKDINNFANAYNIQKKEISICKKCERQAKKKCCKCKGGFDRNSRTKNVCLLDVCVK